MTFEEKLECLETIMGQDFKNWAFVVLEDGDEANGKPETIHYKYSSFYIGKMLLKEAHKDLKESEMEVWEEYEWEEETLEGDEWKNEDN